MTDKDREIARGIPGGNGYGYGTGGDGGGSFKSANDPDAKKGEAKEGEEKKEGDEGDDKKAEGDDKKAEGDDKKAEGGDDKKEGEESVAETKKEAPKKPAGGFLPPELGGPALSQKQARIEKESTNDPELDEINIGGEKIIVGSLGEENMQMDDDLRSHDIVEYL